MSEEQRPIEQVEQRPGSASVTISFEMDIQAAYEKAKKALEEEIARQMTKSMRVNRWSNQS